MTNKPGNEEISGIDFSCSFSVPDGRKKLLSGFFYFYREETEGPLPLKTKKFLPSHKIFFFCTTES